MFPKKLQDKLNNRISEQAFRQLGQPHKGIDFSSNDYLGFSKSATIFEQAQHYLTKNQYLQNGATGSRLLSGNHPLFQALENQLHQFHGSETALVFNSGYDANLGFFSAVPQRNDLIFYDEFCHASIRDGIGMSNAKAHKFKHNAVDDLEGKLKRHAIATDENRELYVVTESVFSMDGDSPDLKKISEICHQYSAHLVVDEAHAIGVFGKNGNGLIPKLELETQVFARIITFGKAMGCHGAAILGSKALRDYLINFCRPFIYTTALPPHSLATLMMVYTQLAQLTDTISAQAKLVQNIAFFQSEVKRLKLQQQFISSHSAIQCCIIPGNAAVKKIAKYLQDNGFEIKPILSPTVSKEKERLRFCLHSFNSSEEISEVLNLLAIFTRA